MSKIKWDDDRVKQAVRALLLLAREKLSRGETADLIASSLAEFRDDPGSFKARHWNKAAATWSDPKDVTSLKLARHVTYYRELLAETEAMIARFKRNQTQFSSVTELDNYFVTYLKGPEASSVSGAPAVRKTPGKDASRSK